jgi:hypothetical protein
MSPCQRTKAQTSIVRTARHATPHRADGGRQEREQLEKEKAKAKAAALAAGEEERPSPLQRMTLILKYTWLLCDMMIKSMIIKLSADRTLGTPSTPLIITTTLSFFFFFVLDFDSANVVVAGTA